MSTVTYKGVVSSERPHKSLVTGGKRGVGRNNRGRITVRHKGGGHKRLFRDVDFRLNKIGIPGRVERVEYDPFRSGFIALVVYRDGERRYMLAPKDVRPGSSLLAAENAPIEPGNRLPLSRIPLGTFVYNLELKPGGGAKLCRSAGNFATVIAFDGGYANIKLPSGEVRKISEQAWASIGEVSNAEHHLEVGGKAGRTRWRGVRPTVRGSAMNPVDHPYGGGEGRQGRGTRYPKTLWGKHVGGVKTRKPKKYSNLFILSRRKTGKKRS